MLEEAGESALRNDQIAIGRRFADAFEFAYNRFRELKEKEDQNRELTVQNALERVRARALGMQTSDELAGVATAFFGEFQDLGLQPLTVWVNVVNREDETIQTFITGIKSKDIFNRTEDDLQSKPGTVQTFEELRNMGHDLDGLLQAWENEETYYLERLRKKEDAIPFVNQGRHFQSLSAEQKEQLIDAIPDISYGHTVFYSQGWLSMDCAESRPEEDIAIVKRFAEVFDFAYARFLELKAKEDQNRELTIQNALERVRSRALGMQVSDELAGVAKALFDAFKNLEFELYFTSLTIVDQEAELIHQVSASAISEEILGRTNAEMNRELTIQNALERVRSRALGMQESEEMKDVVSELFKACEELGFSVWTSNISLFEEVTDEVAVWYAHDEVHGTVGVHSIPSSRYEKLEYSGDVLRQFKSGNHQPITQSWQGDDVRQSFESYFDAVGLKKETAEKYIQHLPESINPKIVFFNHGWLSANDRGDTVDLDVFQRLANVFEFSYDRFLELKQKEDQNRELTVQNALERVRSRALGMQESDELSGVATALFDEFENLEFELFGVTIGIIDREKEIMHDFTRNPAFNALFERSEEELQVRPGHMLTFEDLKNRAPLFEIALQKWEAGDKYFLYQSKREEVVQTYLNAPPFQNLQPEKRAQLPEVISAENLDVCRRFTEAFDFAYGRFLELKAKEDQNRELTIQNALERVRSRALGMQTSDEIAGVATALFDEFENMDFGLSSVNVSVFDFEKEIVQTFSRSPALQEIIGRTVEELEKRPGYVMTFEELPNQENLARALEAREKGEPYITMRQRERDEYIQVISNRSWFTNLSPEQQERWLESVPERVFRYRIFFAQGVVALVTSGELTDEDLNAAQRFTEAFDFAYDRFRELKEKEEQNRELTIQNALERVIRNANQ